MRRALAIIAVIWFVTIPRAAGDPGDIDAPTLSAKEVARYFAPYADGVRTCYLAHARNLEATGLLRLELLIHHHGAVFRFGFTAPGVSKPNMKKLDACLRKLSATWRFPLRTGFTSAVLPFVFQRANVPGAGPFESCWDPKGCYSGRSDKGQRAAGGSK